MDNSSSHPLIEVLRVLSKYYFLVSDSYDGSFYSLFFSADLNKRNLNIIDGIEGGRIVSMFSLCLSCQQDPSHTLTTIHSILSFLLSTNTLDTQILSVGNSKFKFRRLLIVPSVTEILYYGKFKWFDFNI